MSSERPWPGDPKLDPFRDAVWELGRHGRVQGHLTSRVVPVRQWWARRELLWYRVHWLDGRPERAQTDSGPLWSVASDLAEGRFEVLDIADTVLDARPVTGAERDALWARYGPPA